MIDMAQEYNKINIPKEKKSFKGLDEILNTFY